MGVRHPVLLVTAYAFLVTYQAYYLLEELGTAEDDVPHQIFLGTLVQSAAIIITSPIAGKLSDWPVAARCSCPGRRGLRARATR